MDLKEVCSSKNKPNPFLYSFLSVSNKNVKIHGSIFLPSEIY